MYNTCPYSSCSFTRKIDCWSNSRQNYSGRYYNMCAPTLLFYLQERSAYCRFTVTRCLVGRVARSTWLEWTCLLRRRAQKSKVADTIEVWCQDRPVPFWRIEEEGSWNGRNGSLAVKGLIMVRQEGTTVLQNLAVLVHHQTDSPLPLNSWNSCSTRVLLKQLLATRSISYCNRIHTK